MTSPSDYSEQCHQKALFFYWVSNWFLMFAPILLFLICTALIAIIRVATPGNNEKFGTSTASASTTPEQSSSIPGPATGSTDEEQPPPYEPAHQATTTTNIATSTAPTTTPSTTAVTSRSAYKAVSAKEARKSAASVFVLGTIFLLGLIAMLFLTWLSIQSLLYCPKGESSIWICLFWYTIYSGFCLWATQPLMCWGMLVRDLWGPKAKAKLPLDENWLLMRLTASIMFIVAFPFAMLHTGGTRVVEWCQGRFCGDEESEVAAEEASELEEGRRLVEHVDQDDEADSASLAPASAKPKNAVPSSL